MKNVRVFFSKSGRLKFISHLDMNRFFTRVLRKSGLPIWYTEGFNPHPYLTFALPLSLGFESRYEVLDFRLVDEAVSYETVAERLSEVLPCDIKIIKVDEPVMKVGKISEAGFDLTFADENEAQGFYEYLNGGNVVILKKTKKGEIKVDEISSRIAESRIEGNCVSVILPAGNDNINPSLIVASYAEKIGKTVSVSYIRTAVYGENRSLFV
ncbi:MAG: TIGR03936 family radical SAM-associated protein [Acutalibacteraceae bacterium]|nr:TIGR03936 family radical SAM-associated protein [Acutalibacteraceae bacterium]